MLEAIPDLLAHLRSLTDPLKGTDYSRERSGGGARPFSPPPVPVELFDAADYLLTVLWSAVEVMHGREPQGARVVPVTADAVEVYRYAEALRDELLAGLSEFSRREPIVPFVDALIGRPRSHDEWTAATIAERWSLVDEPWWAVQPCPGCGLRGVKVTPPRTPGDETEFRCRSCGWEPDEAEREIALEVFTRQEERAA